MNLCSKEVAIESIPQTAIDTVYGRIFLSLLPSDCQSADCMLCLHREGRNSSNCHQFRLCKKPKVAHFVQFQARKKIDEEEEVGTDISIKDLVCTQFIKLKAIANS